jgi:protein-S-isoprenylcysteine O-methyltransferase Ste14
MRRLASIIGSAVFLVIAPGTVAVLVPRWISHWKVLPPLLGFFGFRIVGILMAACGAGVLIDSFARFALQGLGTPSPVMPTKHLVITGLYRYVRNPMYVGVFSMIIGQALLFGNLRVLWYGVAVGVAVALFVLLYEEPTLRRTFGSEYDEFCANVPRWIPRLSPWRKNADASP